VNNPFNLDIDSDVLPGGEITLTAGFDTYIGSGIEQPVAGGSPVLSA
jgi:hypothetical protein